MKDITNNDMAAIFFMLFIAGVALFSLAHILSW